MTDTATSNGLVGQLREMVNDAGRLVRYEVQLARLEAEQKLRQIGTGIWLLGLGLVFAVVTLVLVTQALVELLSRSMEPWLANLVVAGGAALLCLVLLLLARRTLSAENLTPTRTIRSLSKDAEVIQEASNDQPR